MARVWQKLLIPLALLLPVATYASNLNGSCLIVPSKVVEMTSSIQGVISERLVKRGDRVKKGQTILKIDSGVEQANYDLAEAKLAFAKRKLERNKDLLKDNIVSQQEIDELETEIELTRLQRNQAKALLDKHLVRSPIDGYVMSLSADAGELTGNNPFAQLVSIDPLHAEVIMPAQLYGMYKKGDIIELNINSLSRKVAADIEVIDPVIDLKSGTFGMQLRIKKHTGVIPAGLRCSLAHDKQSIGKPLQVPNKQKISSMPSKAK